MYLSRLTVNPRSPEVRRDLASPHEMHRTLMRAFPDKDAGGPGRVLFRVEPTSSPQPPVVLVQSEQPPDWEQVKAIAGYLLDCAAKPVEYRFVAGQQLLFRLRANPTVKREGKRIPLTAEAEQRQWLERKAQQSGFGLIDYTVRRAERLTSTMKGVDANTRVHWAADYEGRLEVADPEQFTEAVHAGIGPAKAFGMGLLSVARAR